MQFHDKTAYVWGLRYRWDPSLSMNPVRQFAHFMPPWSVLYQPTIFAPVLSIPMSCLTCVSLWRYLPNVSPNKPSWKVSAMVVFFSKLEVIHKQVEGRLILYNPQLSCLRKLEVIWPDFRILLRHPELWMVSVWPSHLYIGTEVIFVNAVTAGGSVNFLPEM